MVGQYKETFYLANSLGKLTNTSFELPLTVISGGGSVATDAVVKPQTVDVPVPQNSSGSMPATLASASNQSNPVSGPTTTSLT